MIAPDIPENAPEQIHRASLDLLWDPGIRIEHDDIYSQLITAGASPGNSAQVVRIPEELVRESLQFCPKEFGLTDKSGKATPLAARSPSNFWSVPGMSIFKDGIHRLFTSADMADISRLLDQLENISVIFGLAMDDIPPDARDIVGLKIMALNSHKHLRVLCFTPQGASALKEIKPIVGNHPWFSIGFTAHGPLRWTHLALEIFKNTAGAGIPTTINGEPMAGTSAPITLAGAAAVGNAEILAGVVINQSLEPGRPCIYNLGLAHIFDMRTAIAVTGAPENALLACLSGLMGRFYDLPSASWVSTESMVPDSQAALEKMFGFYTHLAGGVSCIWGVGQLESELTFSPAQAVMDNEMISYLMRFQRGVAVDSSTLALPLTREVGIGGSFLESIHTLKNCRKEFYYPRTLCRIRRDPWTQEGSKRLDQKAEELASQLMCNPVQNGLSASQIQELEKATAEFLKRIDGK